MHSILEDDFISSLVEITEISSDKKNYRACASAAKSFAIQYKADAWLRRSCNENEWQIFCSEDAYYSYEFEKLAQEMNPSKESTEDDDSYWLSIVDDEMQREQDSWHDRYGYPWSAP